jgi:hypothetical protein
MRLNKVNKLIIALEDLGTETILQLFDKCQDPAELKEFIQVLAITNFDLKKLVKTAKNSSSLFYNNLFENQF